MRGGCPRSKSVSWGPSGRQGILRKTRGPKKVRGGPQTGEVPQESGGSVTEGDSPQKSAGLLRETRPSEKWGLSQVRSLNERGISERGGGFPQRSESSQTRGSTHWRRFPRRSGSLREARGTGSRGPATSGAGPSLTEVARRLRGWLLGPGQPWEVGSGPVFSGPAAAAPSGGARSGSGDRTTDGRPTDCAGGARRVRAAGVRVRAPGR